MSEELIDVAVEEQAPIETPEQVEAPIETAEEATKAQKMSNASADNSTFNWDAFESENFYDADRAAIEESYSQTLSRVNENEVVEGVVVAKDKREVIVDIGYKSEGVINISEFRYNPNLQVGDKVEVFVENAEDKGGQLILSHKRARSLRAWDKINEAYDKEEVIEGFVK